MMGFFVGLGVTLVVAQILGAVIMTVASFKLVSSKWFMKKYMAWFTNMTNDIAKEMEEAFEDKEL